MYKDNNGLLISETSGFPGSIGDSCANTFRHYYFKGEDVDSIQYGILCYSFITRQGFMRHPASPWREDDFSGDQYLPMLVFFDAQNSPQVRQWGFRWHPGNRTLFAPVIWAHIFKLWHVAAACTFIQALLFKYVPWRWNDESRGLERMESSSADYLNWLVSVHFLRQYRVAQAAFELLGAEHVMAKIRAYFAPEPNSDWVIADYQKAVNEVVDASS